MGTSGSVRQRSGLFFVHLYIIKSFHFAMGSFFIRLQRSILYGFMAIFGLLVPTRVLSQAPSIPCPKILMFDGVSIDKHTNDSAAQYWGQKIGLDGFFVNHVVSDWGHTVGDDETSLDYQRVKQFQDLYAKYGVGDNFLKIALYTPHDWQNPVAQSRVVTVFRQAAHLARYAGLKGLALDLEPYVKHFWNIDPAVPEKAELVSALGKQIGDAIVAEFPTAMMIILPEILMYTCPPYEQHVCDNYALSSRFWAALSQARFRQLIIATENSYDASNPEAVVNTVQDVYEKDLRRRGIDPKALVVAPGIWPLGKSYTDKTAHSTPAQFRERLRSAAQGTSPYIWIYGHGSAWEKDGPYGQGNVDPQFEQFVQVVHQFKQACH